MQQLRHFLVQKHSPRVSWESKLYLATVRLGRHQCSWPNDEWASFSEESAPHETGEPPRAGTLEYDVRTGVLVLDESFNVLEQWPLFARRPSARATTSNWTTSPPAEDATLVWDEIAGTLWLRFNFLQVGKEPQQFLHMFGSNVAPLHISYTTRCPQLITAMVDSSLKWHRTESRSVPRSADEETTSSSECAPLPHIFFDYSETVSLGTNGRNNAFFRQPASDSVDTRKTQFEAVEWVYPTVRKTVDLEGAHVTRVNVPSLHRSPNLPVDFRLLHGSSSRLVLLPGRFVVGSGHNKQHLEAPVFLGIGHLHRGGVNESVARWGHHYLHFFFTIDARTKSLMHVSPEFCFSALREPTGALAADEECEVIQFASTIVIDDADSPFEATSIHDNVLLTYGVNDCESALLKLSLQHDILPLLSPAFEQNDGDDAVVDHRQKVVAQPPLFRVQLTETGSVPMSDAFEAHFRNSSVWHNCVQSTCMAGSGILSPSHGKESVASQADENEVPSVSELMSNCVDACSVAYEDRWNAMIAPPGQLVWTAVLKPKFSTNAASLFASALGFGLQNSRDDFAHWHPSVLYSFLESSGHAASRRVREHICSVVEGERLEKFAKPPNPAICDAVVRSFIRWCAHGMLC